MTLNDYAKEIRKINEVKGWNVFMEEEWYSEKYKFPAIIALIHSEASEALEAFRKDEKEHAIEEVIDCIIRCLDALGGFDVDLDKVLKDKLEKNRHRTHRHGGKRV